MDPMSLAIKYGWILIVVILVMVLEKLLLRYFFGTVIVSKDQIGIVNKKWVLLGKPSHAARRRDRGAERRGRLAGRYAGPGNPLWAVGVAVRRLRWRRLPPSTKTRSALWKRATASPFKRARAGQGGRLQLVPEHAAVSCQRRRARAADLGDSARNLPHQHGHVYRAAG